MDHEGFERGHYKTSWTSSVIVNYTFGLVVHTKDSYSKVQEPFNEEDKSPLQEFNQQPLWFYQLSIMSCVRRRILGGYDMIFHKSREECLSRVLYHDMLFYCDKRYQSNGLVFARPWFQSGQS